jgi:hypothetical protein
MVKQALHMEQKYSAAAEAEEDGDDEAAQGLREEAHAIEVCGEVWFTD